MRPRTPRHLRDQLRDLILAEPDTPATVLATRYGLRPIQVAGYRAGATLRRTRTRAARALATERASAFTGGPLPPRVARKLLVARRRAAQTMRRSLRKALRTNTEILRALTNIIIYLDSHR